LTTDQPSVIQACPTWEGEKYALKSWAAAYRAQTYANKGALQVDNSNGPTHGGGLHYVHAIRAEGIPAIWQQTRFPALWDTLELSWTLIVEYAAAHGFDFIFSCEADVIPPPDAIEKLVATSLANFDPETKRPAVVTQRYHPRGQDGPSFWWDTLGCSLFPVAPLYEGIHLVTALYEIDVFTTCRDAGYPRYRPGVDGPDLFIPEHLKDPEDAYGEDVGATPAAARYQQRVDAANRALIGEKPTPTERPASKGGPEERTLPTAPEPCPPPMLKGSPAAMVKTTPGSPTAVPFADVMGDPEKARRVMSEDRIRLNIGSDWSQISGFLSVDFNPDVSPDVLADGKDLPFPDDSVDEIYASHVLEHFTWSDGLVALKEWLRVLKPGGMLTVATPDIEGIYHCYKHGQTWGEYNLPMNDVYIQAVAFGANLLADEIPEMQKLYGGPGHKHQSIYLRDMLLNRVLEAGFVWASEVTRCFLRGSAVGETMVQARKPKQGE
jgi:predicted SAM-dependent methyltransferase